MVMVVRGRYIRWLVVRMVDGSMADEKTTMSIRFSPVLAEKLAEEAQASGRSVQEIVVSAVARYLGVV